MNREQAKELLPVITAFVEGKEIQFLGKHNEKWVDVTDSPWFDPSVGSYRIKPEEVKVIRYGIALSDSGEFLTTFATKEAADNYVARGGARLVAFPMAGSYER